MYVHYRDNILKREIIYEVPGQYWLSANNDGFKHL